MQVIQEILYILSSAFLLPTLVGTLLAFAYGTYVVGQFLAEAADRSVNRQSRKELYAGAPSEERFAALPWKGYLMRYREARLRYESFPPMIDREIAEIEHEMAGRVERLGIVSKVGPMLGLIGTLIPLQPALAGLARGDMQTMGANLQIGFTTTVLGLLVGGVCYAISVVMRNWYQQDVAEIHFLQALWAEEPDESTQQIAAEAADNGTGLAPRREAVL